MTVGQGEVSDLRLQVAGSEESTVAPAITRKRLCSLAGIHFEQQEEELPIDKEVLPCFFV